MKSIPTAVSVCFASFLFLTGCATETSKSLATPQVISADSTYNGPRFSLTIGKFENRSSFLRGLLGVLVNSVIHQLASQVGNPAYGLSKITSARLLTPRPGGILFGPRSPQHGKD